MENIKAIAEKVNEALQKNKVQKAKYSISFTETREMNAEGDSFSLLKTLFDHNFGVNIIQDEKSGSANINKVDEASIEATILSALESAKSANPDSARDIAPGLTPETFEMGCYEPDMETLFDRTKELLDNIKEKHPKIKIMKILVNHSKKHTIFCTTNGTCDEVFSGCYSLFLEFAGNEGDKTTGIFGSGVSTTDLSKPFITLGNIEQSLTDAENSLNPCTFEGKENCTVIFTPEGASEMIYMTLQNFIQDKTILDQSSPWSKKLGQKIGADCLTLSAAPLHESFPCHEVHTSDGFRSENYDIIKNGVLNQFMISLYVANKTGNKVAPNSSGMLILQPGKTPLADMIKDIKRGVLVNAFSGGDPNISGEFSGVIKNSFLIENGKITNAVSETMINGNLLDFFNNIVAISKETINNGSTIFPWIAVKDIVVSGK